MLNARDITRMLPMYGYYTSAWCNTQGTLSEVLNPWKKLYPRRDLVDWIGKELSNWIGPSLAR
jgi:hypothetical protein